MSKMVIRVDDETVFKAKSFAERHGCETCVLSTYLMSVEGEESDLEAVEEYVKNNRRQ